MQRGSQTFLPHKKITLPDRFPLASRSISAERTFSIALLIRSTSVAHRRQLPLPDPQGPVTLHPRRRGLRQGRKLPLRNGAGSFRRWRPWQSAVSPGTGFRARAWRKRLSRLHRRRLKLRSHRGPIPPSKKHRRAPVPAPASRPRSDARTLPGARKSAWHQGG